MTETAMDPVPTTGASAWDAAFAALKARFPKAKNSIVFAIHALQADPNVALDDLKAQAQMHGIRITGGSVNAAHRLMAGTPKAAMSPSTTPSPVRPAPRARANTLPADPAAMIQQVVAKLQQQSGAEAQRLREAIKKAMAVLQAAVS